MGAKKARCRPMDMILRLLTLNLIHTMRMDWLTTCVTPPEPPDWINSSVIETTFGRFFVILRIGSGHLRQKLAEF